MTRFCRCSLSGFLLAALMICGQVKADVVNGSFESFFGSWTTVGPNTATTSVAGVSPTDGSRMAYLNNGIGSLPLPIHGFIVDSNLGLTPGTTSLFVQSNFPNATEGATLFQTFFMDDPSNPGLDCELSFDYNFLTNETVSTDRQNDFAFFGLFDSAGSIVAAGAVSVFSSTFIGASGPYASQTGWNTVTISNLAGGQNYSLLFGVFDNVTLTGDSAFLVDNVRVTCVPEPSSAFLLGLASAGALGFRRRRC